MEKIDTDKKKPDKPEFPDYPMVPEIAPNPKEFPKIEPERIPPDIKPDRNNQEVFPLKK